MNVVNAVPMPISTIPPAEPSAPHVPVLEREVIAALAPRSGGLYVDATLGAGGHTEAMLMAGAGHVIGLDRDPLALELSAARLARFGDRVELRHAAFGDLRRELDAMGVERVDGVLADLGVSSMQLDDPERGMSFRGAGPLDMRMNPEAGETALELIERLDDDALTDLIAKLGEERRARRVARCIKQAAEAGELTDTLALRRAIVRAVGPTRVGNVDPATRTFQALRIAVNQELGQLERLLGQIGDCLAPGGIVAIISFHSLEDRLVKRAFRGDPRLTVLTKKPIVATEDEVDDNPRARSAKLRVARYIGEH
ncbi:MAG: 16S rRNA (cytosine(1402)-N(4))-methyltransferase RsmH [Polyangiaceae bacterium]